MSSLSAEPKVGASLTISNQVDFVDCRPRSRTFGVWRRI